MPASCCLNRQGPRQNHIYRIRLGLALAPRILGRDVTPVELSADSDSDPKLPIVCMLATQRNKQMPWPVSLASAAASRFAPSSSASPTTLNPRNAYLPSHLYGLTLRTARSSMLNPHALASDIPSAAVHGRVRKPKHNLRLVTRHKRVRPNTNPAIPAR
jgi:hypothetical protein